MSTTTDQTHGAGSSLPGGTIREVAHDADPQETAEWLQSLDYVIESGGPGRATFLLERLKQRALRRGAAYAAGVTTPYVNTIPVDQQPEYPGDRQIERRIKSIIRWNAMAMVVRANQESPGIGGHISTFASAATLYEVAFNHFLHGKEGRQPPDQVFFQGHAAPGIYARAFLLGRLTEEQLKNFRHDPAKVYAAYQAAVEYRGAPSVILAKTVKGYGLGEAGEALQHQDGNSHLFALAYPNLRAYDPAYAYEMSVIVLDGLRRMFYEEEDVFYYVTLLNENYEMPILPLGSTEGICRGMYKLSQRDLGPGRPKVQLFGSGAILREALRAQDLLEDQFGVSSTVYSVTSYKAVLDDARSCARFNRLHPDEEPRKPYVQQVLEGESGPVVAALDYVGAVALSIAPWIGRPYAVLGTDGFGRSEARPQLRRFFEVDAENIALAALTQLAELRQYSRPKLAAAIKTLDLDPEKPNPVTV